MARGFSGPSKGRETLAVRSISRPSLHPQSIRPDHRPVIMLAEKELEKRGPSNSKRTKHHTARRTGAAMDVDSPAPVVLAKWQRQDKLSIKVEGRGDGAS